MFAELSMNHDILKEVITKKVGAPARKTVNPGYCPRSGFECNRSLKIDRYVPFTILLY